MNPGSATFWRIANVAPVLVSTLNFPRIFWTCFSTVRWFAVRIREISQFRLPCMSQCRTSLSRFVNPSFSSLSGVGAVSEAAPFTAVSAWAFRCGFFRTSLIIEKEEVVDDFAVHHFGQSELSLYCLP